jgi:(E)-4-hydroxy-3-methylbut-2-enyl-diphosphate synthase
VYVDGKPSEKFTNENLVDKLESLIRSKATEKQLQLEKDEANIILRV